MKIKTRANIFKNDNLNVEHVRMANLMKIANRKLRESLKWDYSNNFLLG